MSTMPPLNEMHRAMQARDASYDGIFYIAVKTTNVFCRPACPARRPRPSNVEYFPTPDDALRSGYRPCKRCRPLDANGRPPEWVRRLLARVDAEPGRPLGDKDLRAMSIDPARVRRYFKENYGMTFQTYQRTKRMGKALKQIRGGADLAGVGLRHGFESSSGFRDAFSRTFARSPGRSREADCIVTTTLESPVGRLLLGATSKAVCLLEFDDCPDRKRQLDVLQRTFGCALVPGENELIERLKGQLDQYFDGKLQKFTLPLSYPGTPFQTAVWDELRRIPYGRTVSYEHVATAIGHPDAQRAVGTANGRNRIAIVIPCHRVVNKSGELGGYGGGLWRKKLLLELEQQGKAGE